MTTEVRNDRRSTMGLLHDAVGFPSSPQAVYLYRAMIFSIPFAPGVSCEYGS